MFFIFSQFFYFFLFSKYKTVDIINVYKSLNITFETVIKNPEMLKFVPDHLKTKKQSYLLRNVSDKYKTQQMCDKAILENGGTLNSIAECYKNQ